MPTISSVRWHDRNTVDPIPAVFPVDASTPAGVQPVGQSGYTLTFSDEFNGAAIDPAKWDYAYPDWPRFNSQNPGGRYTNTSNVNCYDLGHVALSGGSCILTAEKVSTITGLPYTSGMLSSLPSYTPKYGFMESRIRMSGMPNGVWPAAWTSCSLYDQWPPEIDYLEAGNVSATENLNNVYSPGSNTYFGTVPGVDFTAWHTFAANWQPAGVTFYLDGVQTNTTTLSPSTPQYLILNLGVLGVPSFTSATMEVEYIRYWQ